MYAFGECMRFRGTGAFAGQLKDALLKLPGGTLPLHEALAHGGQVDERNLEIMVLAVIDESDVIRARVGVFFTEIVGNCACGDEPWPAPACCILRVELDPATAAVRFEVLPD